MTVFALSFRSFQGPHSDCLQTSETRYALCTQLDHVFCPDYVECALLFPFALLIFAIFILSLAVWIVTAGVTVFVLWFQYKLSCILVLLGQEDFEFVAPYQLGVVLYAELLVISCVGHICLIFVEV